MSNKTKNRRSRIAVAASCTVGVISLMLLFYLAMSQNVQIQRTRPGESYIRIEDYTREELQDTNAPAGVLVEYRFRISEDLDRDCSLAFYTVHQYVEVYFDEECVYSLFPSDDNTMIRTTGSDWVMIPLYREDVGKQVRVVLTPVYENVKNRSVEFLVGSSMAVFKARLKKDLPILVISGLMVLAGLIIIIIGFYGLHTNRYGWESVALGIFSATLGLWRFTDTRFSPLICPDKPVLLFYISMVSLIFCAIPLMMSQKNRMDSRIVGNYCVVAALVNFGQLILQILGVLDIRETLPMTHAMIIVSVLLIGRMLLMGYPHTTDEHAGLQKWVLIYLAVGAILDLAVYYLRKSSSGLLFTMLALLLYIAYIGITFIDSYAQQKKALVEKEQQIVQARVSTMMSQIRSHFVFNILNAISGMCKYDPEKADNTIVCFARYLRTNINIMEEDGPVPFRTAMQHLEDYITLEQVRFGYRIRFVKDIQVDQFMLPSLILQPLVENSIKYGIKPKPEGGTVTLRTWAEEKLIRISVEDDGIGFDVDKMPSSGSVGIKNVRFRLEQIMHGQLDIQSVPGKGTTVTISIPREEV